MFNTTGNVAEAEAWSAGLAFAGLGHDLTLVRVRASLLELVPVPSEPEARVAVPRASEAPMVSGYELLLRLGREIRAR